MDLDDGRRLAIPTAWSSHLANAAVTARATWRIGDAGDHMSWPDVDEDIGIWTFLGVSEKAVFEANESARSGKRACPPVSRVQTVGLPSAISPTVDDERFVASCQLEGDIEPWLVVLITYRVRRPPDHGRDDLLVVIEEETVADGLLVGGSAIRRGYAIAAE